MLWDAGRARFQFGEFQLDDRQFGLSGPAGAVHVEPQVFELLHHLMTNHDRVVSKEELLDAIWGDRFVSESALTSRGTITGSGGIGKTTVAGGRRPPASCLRFAAIFGLCVKGKCPLLSYANMTYIRRGSRHP